MDEYIRKLLDDAVPNAKEKAQKRDAKLTEESERQTKVGIAETEGYLKDAITSTKLLTYDIIKKMIEQYIGIKEFSVTHMVDTPKEVDFEYDVTNHFRPYIIIKFEEQYRQFLGNNPDRPDDIEFFAPLKQSSFGHNTFEYDGKPIVEARMKTGSSKNAKKRSIPTLFDRQFFERNGIYFKPSNYKISTTIPFDLFESFVIKGINGELKIIDDTYCFVDENATKEYKNKLYEINRQQKQIESFQERCNRGLERVLSEICLGLLAELKKYDSCSDDLDYIVNIPLIICEKDTASRNRQRFNYLYEHAIGEYTIKYHAEQELETQKWLWNNTSFNGAICYFPYGHGIDYRFYPVVKAQLDAKLNEYGWESTIATHYWDEDRLSRSDGLAVKVNSVKFVEQILESQKNKEK